MNLSGTGSALPCSLVIQLVLLWSVSLAASEEQTAVYFDGIRGDHLQLRNFLYHFPKGADLHNHLDGAIYAENYIRWAAADGKCVDLASRIILPAPCDAESGRPALREIQTNSDLINPLIDALSTRNYQRRPVSGHNQFFSTFHRFLEASFGREGHMLAEVTRRAARQNMLYLELMQSWGMAEARQLARDSNRFDASRPLAVLVQNKAIAELTRATITRTDQIEAQRSGALACNGSSPDPGCTITVRYLAQVIRVFPPEQVLAQTLLAFRLVHEDPRYVGINFVAPEDHPVSLRDYRRHMQIIRDIAAFYPGSQQGITLHAGELDIGLVPPEELGWHIRSAIKTAGARRIGHGVDILYEPDPVGLMELMASEGIAVEINLTSNDVILGIKNGRHPFTSYRKHKVPLTLSTDDEGVSRIDLTHEYQRAVQDYDLDYMDIKLLSRSGIAYSFLPGQNLFTDIRRGIIDKRCSRAVRTGNATPHRGCSDFLQNSEKARLQWELELRFLEFESRYTGR